MCLIVDSNLKGIQIGHTGFKVAPYIRCSGKVYCPYTVEPRSVHWPTVDDIRSKQYTDIVIALGINHCKLRDTEQPWVGSANLLCDLFMQYISELPGVRLYCLAVPPSLSRYTNENVIIFNSIVKSRLVRTSVVMVSIPSRLYGTDGLLNHEYARESEMGRGFPDHKKLHLNAMGVAILTHCICRKVRTVSGLRLR